jgi:hypothetical protein
VPPSTTLWAELIPPATITAPGYADAP